MRRCTWTDTESPRNWCTGLEDPRGRGGGGAVKRLIGPEYLRGGGGGGAGGPEGEGGAYNGGPRPGSPCGGGGGGTVKWWTGPEYPGRGEGDGGAGVPEKGEGGAPTTGVFEPVHHFLAPSGGADDGGLRPGSPCGGGNGGTVKCWTGPKYPGRGEGDGCAGVPEKREGGAPTTGVFKPVHHFFAPSPSPRGWMLRASPAFDCTTPAAATRIVRPSTPIDFWNWRTDLEYHRGGGGAVNG